MADSVSFPAGFLWGAATSAYQIEGSPLAEGAGPSIWHRFSHTPGCVRDGDTGDVACDHYNRFREDVALMRELGLGAYRFSIAWGRVLPEGTGRVNQRGLDFYRRLVDALREAGIAPVATLYHWDLPAALDDRGGWTNRDVADWFAEYAAVCYQALDDRVELWATLNEPWVVTDGGYLTGVLAPGRRSAFAAALAGHNLLRAHAAAVAAYRAMGRQRIGVVVNLEPKHPASDRPDDHAAAARADAYMNRHYLDPLLLGRYPEELAGIYGEAWREDFDREAESLSVPIDWLGINYYSRNVVRHQPDAWPLGAARVRQARAIHTETDWEVYPAGLEETLLRVARRYRPLPLYVTENGAAFYDPPSPVDGRVDDPLRIAYLRDHLRAIGRAIAAGADVRGYFAWSLLDNLEWSHGFSKRFGIVHVDFATLQRTVKASGRWYSEVARTQGASLG
ncbi:MAG TPA: GH1 family beta-glucosidase [Thermoanaerobaculia bacterium]|jgi:beta-glucosidase|nr:GH1 family beta-glucosidase [Thermoanaerobaculia bacterium]